MRKEIHPLESREKKATWKIREPEGSLGRDRRENRGRYASRKRPVQSFSPARNEGKKAPSQRKKREKKRRQHRLCPQPALRNLPENPKSCSKLDKEQGEKLQRILRESKENDSRTKVHLAEEARGSGKGAEKGSPRASGG